jgi:hypothetical protein
MDKYEGIKKAESISYEKLYLTQYQNIISEKIKQKNIAKKDESSSEFVFSSDGKKKEKNKASRIRKGYNAFRYCLCLFVALVCIVGSYTSLSVAKTASTFIKEQLQRDILQEIADEIKEK